MNVGGGAAWPSDVSQEVAAPQRALAELVEHTVVPDDDRVVGSLLQLDRLVSAVPVARMGFDAPADGVAVPARVGEEAEVIGAPT